MLTNENVINRLTYFALRGRADPIRLMLEAKNMKYEFVGVEFKDWNELKPKFQEITPFGQLPVLELIRNNDSENPSTSVLCQTLTIARHVSKITGLDCANVKPYENNAFLPSQICDEVCEVAQSLLVEISRLFWEGFHEKREDQAKALTKVLENLTKYFLRIRVHDLHWVGDELSQADIYMAFFLEQIPLSFPGIFTKETFPELFTFYESTFQSPGIREYVISERRPKNYTVSFAAFGGKPEECVQWS